MNERRAFTVVVTGCKNCPNIRRGEQRFHATCNATLFNSLALVRDNYQDITESCPMCNEAKQQQEGEYIRQRATEIVELKAKLAEVMPLAKFGALIATNGILNLSDDAYKSGVFKDPNFLCKHDNIEATITKLLRD
jgi:hypothetical protein